VRGVFRDIAAVMAFKAAVSAAVLFMGFVAVSDDDFARVVIAEQWAASPRLDPSGTSWLPFPFWLNGLVFAIFGRDLGVARALALVLGCASIAIVYLAARWITEDRRAALAGTVIAALFPWSARLGVATVPELPTAALMLLAMASLVGPISPARRLAGGVALLAATLSRYEAWPVAAAFALLCALDALNTKKRRATGLVAAALALLGPLAWIAHNRLAHGDALHFLARVAAYRKALGGVESGALSRLYAYPLAMLREEPELVASLVILLAATAWLRCDHAHVRTRLRSFARPLLLAGFQIAALSLAMIKDGAPTHHPERAVLVALLLVALAMGVLLVDLARASSARARAALAAPILAALALGPLVARRWFPGESMAARRDEIAIGQIARERTNAGERVLVEIVDYGYFAILAALGRPEDAILDRSIDPREPQKGSSFDAASALDERIASSGARHVIGRITEATRATLGEPVATEGAWGLWMTPEKDTKARP